MVTENRKPDTSETSLLSETGLNFSQIKELMTHMKKEGVTAFAMGEGKTSLSLTREKEIVCVASGEGSHTNRGMHAVSWNESESDFAGNTAAEGKTVSARITKTELPRLTAPMAAPSAASAARSGCFSLRKSTSRAHSTAAVPKTHNKYKGLNV